MIGAVMDIGLIVWKPIILALLLFLFAGIIIYNFCFFRPALRNRKALQPFIAQDQYEYVLVDLRDPKDYREKHISSALNMPFKAIFRCPPTENMFETIFVYGYRYSDARRARRWLDTYGYFNVYSLGPFRHWKGPFEKDN